MSNDVLEAVESSGLLGDLCSVVVGYIREPPRPYIYRPLPWARVELDDRSDTFGSYITDLLTLPGT
jgi:hypothetical protein